MNKMKSPQDIESYSYGSRYTCHIEPLHILRTCEETIFFSASYILQHLAQLLALYNLILA